MVRGWGWSLSIFFYNFFLRGLQHPKKVFSMKNLSLVRVRLKERKGLRKGYHSF